MKMNHFQTSDFPLAVTLVTLGHPVEYIDRDNPKRAQFHFKRTSILDESVQAFWRGEIRIEPRLFCVNQRLLKSQLYS